MRAIWKYIRKPLVWGPLFVLSVLAFNVLMDHKTGTTAIHTFFATIFALCMAKPCGKGYVRRKGFFENSSKLSQKSSYEKESDRRLMTYGSRAYYTFYDFNRKLGRHR